MTTSARPAATRAVAEFVARARLAAMPPAVLESAKVAIRDTIGVALAA